MDNLFLLLFLASIACLIIGLTKPSTFSRFSKKKLTKKKVGLVFALSAIVFLIAFGLTTDAKPQEKSKTDQSADKTATQSATEQPKQDSQKEERKKALDMVLDYQLQKDLSTPHIDKTTTLRRAFQIMTSDNILQSSTGWFAVKEGDRIVVGWKGLKVGQVHTPQWQVKDGNISRLNGTAGAYTPELTPAVPEISGVSEKDKQIYNRFNEIIDTEVMPEFDRKSDEAGTSDTKLGQINEWYDAQEDKAMARVANEFGISTEEANNIYSKVTNQDVARGNEFAESKGKILSNEEIDKLLQEQGKLE